MITTLTFNNMSNNIQHPYSVPAHLQGKTQKGFQGGKAKVLELLNTLDLQAFVKQFTRQVLPRESSMWFFLDCAKLVLPFFEEQYPSDKRVRECIEVVESYLNGKSNLKAFSIADPDTRDVARAAYSAFDASCDADNYNTHTAACAACAAEAAVDAADFALDAGHYAAHSTYYAFPASKNEMQGFVKNWIDQYFNTK